jgi:hypothetical protein
MDTYADDLAELLARLIARSLPGLGWPLAVRSILREPMNFVGAMARLFLLRL